MTLTLSMLVTADAKGAKAELATTATEAKKLGTATTDAGGKARSAGTGVSALGGASAATAAKVTALANAEAAAGVTAVKMGQSHTLAAGSVANLTAQFNDIGMMLAAGQNPIQLALQQGTSISQVIGPMGAAGAVKALGTAFMGMISPVSLITLGSIAAGAAMLQWLTSAGDEAPKLEDAITSLSDAVGDFRATANDQSLDNLAEKFGAVTPEVVALQRELQELQLRQIALDAAAAGAALAQAFNYDGFLTTGAIDLQNLFDLSLGQVAQMQAMFREIGEAATFTEQLAAIDALQAGILAATGGVDEMDAAQVAFYQTTLDAESALRQAEAAAASIAGIDIQSGISAAASEAWSLADALALAALNKAALAEGRVGAGAGRGGDPRRFEQDPYWNEKFFPDPQNVPKARPSRSGSGRGSSGGGTSEIEKQRQALDDLIEREERELAILRETDPLKKEMLRNREAMAGATDAERAKVEELISTRLREKDVMEEIRDRTAEFGNVGEQAFKGLITGAHGLKGALSMVLDKMADMVASSAWDALWSGGKSGGGGLGGWISSALSGLMGGGGKGGAVKKADGGKIGGTGGPREDNIPIWASSGEFMINAAATAQHQPLLEAINGGASPRQIMAMASGARAYADGGMIGGAAPSAYRGGGAMFGGASAASAAGSAPASGGIMHVSIDLRGAQGDKTIEARTFAGVQAALQEFSRKELPGRIAQLNRDPRRIG